MTVGRVTPQEVPPVFRHLSVDFLSIGLRHDARDEPSDGPNAKRLHRTKLVAALAVAAVVGAGSYTATYRALVILSTPSALAPTPATGPSTVPSATPVPTLFRSDA
jgi:hypothetical protein